MTPTPTTDARIADAYRKRYIDRTAASDQSLARSLQTTRAIEADIERRKDRQYAA